MREAGGAFPVPLPAVTCGVALAPQSALATATEMHVPGPRDCHVPVFLLCFLGDVLDCLLLLLFIMVKNVCNSIFNFLELFLVAFKIAAASQCDSFSYFSEINYSFFSNYLLSILPEFPVFYSPFVLVNLGRSPQIAGDLGCPFMLKTELDVGWKT